MTRNRVLKGMLASAGLAPAIALALAAPPALAQEAAPDAERARSAAHAASAAFVAAAEATRAAATAAAPPSAMAVPVAPPALVAPPAPTAPPVLTFASASPEPAQDLPASADAMPVASAKLLARLTAEPAPAAPATPPALIAPPAPTAAPDFLPVEAAPPPAPIAPPTVLAGLGAAPVTLPSAAALEAAVAAQATPPRAEPVAAPAPVPAPVYVAAPAPAPRAEYASFAPRRSRRSATTAGNARFMRAVVSTAAVSIEMPDVSRQVSPLGLLLGQLVTSQETPGSQYGLQEEMAMPTRPRLMAMPEVAVPQGFCSAEQRGAFLEGIYQPALAIAQHNSEVAAAYVRRLRTLYDNYQLSGDTRAQGAIAAEARDFARTANAASSIHDELSGQFEDIMTTPVSTCGASQ